MFTAACHCHVKAKNAAARQRGLLNVSARGLTRCPEITTGVLDIIRLMSIKSHQ